MMTRMSALLSFLLRRGALLALLCVTLATFSVAQGAGANQGSDPQANSSSPGDDVTSLPFTGPSGTTLVGSPRAVRALVLGTDGRGTVSVQRLAPGLIAATFAGNVQLRLDRGVLASGAVMVLYLGGADETGLLTLVGQSPTMVETERLPLPLGRMAASTLSGPWLRLQAFDDASVTNVSVTADRVSVTLTQFTRQ
jgi:hypothetical protein